MAEAIGIKKAVLHILDNNINIPVLSGRELEADDEIPEFLEKHINKILEDNNLKNARFTGDNNNVRSICEALKSDDEYFLEASIALANRLFDIMLKNVDIVPADLICCLFDCDGQPYAGILKLNYKSGFTHHVTQGEEGNANTIIRHKTILPSEGQKVDECALISLDSFDIKLMEKEYDINGEKEFYLSKLFLCCTTDLSSNEKLKIIDKVTKKINKKYFDEDFEKVAKLKKAVSESLEESGAVEVDTLMEEVFETNMEIRDECLTEIRKAGLTDRTVQVPEKLAEKKFKTHKITTDTGIEINFPLSYYDDKERLEFINNPDGTISIIIKNVGKILNK